MAIDLVEVNDRPMTLIYPGAKTYPAPADEKPWKADRYHLAHNTVAADGTVGIRIPMMEFCQQLTYKLGRPIVSTSANISGEPTPKKLADMSDEIKNAVDYTVEFPSRSRGHRLPPPDHQDRPRRRGRDNQGVISNSLQIRYLPNPAILHRLAGFHKTLLINA